MLFRSAAFDSFLAAAHKRGMKVLLDGVFNRAGRGFFQFNHILENGAASPYKDRAPGCRRTRGRGEECLP